MTSDPTLAASIQNKKNTAESIYDVAGNNSYLYFMCTWIIIKCIIYCLYLQNNVCFNNTPYILDVLTW